jgi:processing peptidase subunit beta
MQTIAEPMAWNQAPAVVTTLPNGVRVATKETFGEMASLGVFLNIGVRDETRNMAGVTYVVDQLALTGTAKRRRNVLEKEVESMGATLSHTSGREQTSYTMSLFHQDLKQGMEIISDCVTDVPVGNYAKEKGNILRKLAEREVPTREVMDDRLHACAFRDVPLGFSAVGPFDNIDELTWGDLKAYVDYNYRAQNTVLVATGPVAHAEVVELAQAGFGHMTKAKLKPVGTRPYFCGAELLYRNDEMGPTAYIAAGFESVPWRSPDAVTFMLMESLIGHYKKGVGLVPGTISGNRVVNGVANKMEVGCADEFETFNRFYRDTGVFGFYIECDEVAVEHAVGELMFGLNMLSFSVTDEEVERAKRELKAKLFSAPTSAEAACKTLGKEMLAYGRGLPLAEMVLRIDAIDAQEVKRVAWKYLNDNEIAVTGLGPLHGMPQYYDLRKMTCTHRY